MVSVDKAQIAKYKKGGNHFEILIDSNLALQLKQGKQVSMADVLAVNRVFKDAKKGMEASSALLKEAFQTDDIMEIARQIIMHGEVHATAEFKSQLREQKRKQVVNIIHRNAVDPKTHIPHPVTRIESAMEEAKCKIDENVDAIKQVDEVLKKIRLILPIKFEQKEISIKIPADYAAKSYSVVTSFGKKLREDWQSDGSWVVVIEIPGGLEEEMHDKLNALTHGNVETKILNIK